jgi:hypothetical protein
MCTSLMDVCGGAAVEALLAVRSRSVSRGARAVGHARHQTGGADLDVVRPAQSIIMCAHLSEVFQGASGDGGVAEQGCGEWGVGSLPATPHRTSPSCRFQVAPAATLLWPMSEPNEPELDIQTGS